MKQKTSRRILVPLGLAVSALSCAQRTVYLPPADQALVLSGTNSELSHEQAAVQAELEQYYADFSARDWELFSDHFWPGATVATTWTPAGETAKQVMLSTIPDFVAKAPEGPGSMPIFAEWMTSSSIRIDGDLASARVEYAAHFGTQDELMEWDGVDVFALLHCDGRWRISSLSFASNSH